MRSISFCIRICLAPGFLDFQCHRFAERLKGRLDLVEARGVVAMFRASRGEKRLDASRIDDVA
jgi:hypothetical protein